MIKIFHYIHAKEISNFTTIFFVRVGNSKKDQAAHEKQLLSSFKDPDIYYHVRDGDALEFVAKLKQAHPHIKIKSVSAHELWKAECANAGHVLNLSIYAETFGPHERRRKGENR